MWLSVSGRQFPHSLYLLHKIQSTITTCKGVIPLNKLLHVAASFLLLSSSVVWAHHPAADIVDPEVYAMIDSLVADTPHADLVLEDMGSNRVDMTVTANSLRTLESMIDDGLLDYALTLDGSVSVSINANGDGSVTMTISQLRM
jgi:hypothetical protein